MKQFLNLLSNVEFLNKVVCCKQSNGIARRKILHENMLWLEIIQVMDEFKVEIRLPRSTDVDPNLVVIAGKDEDSVYDCIEQLRREEEEFLQVLNCSYISYIRN